MDYYISLLAVLFLSLSCYGVRGKSFSDLDIDQQLKILNKPFIKSFQDEAGDIYDCVDINKQPAFDHPLLKNHKIPRIPPRFPTKSGHGTTSTNQQPRTSKKSIECPQGYVPIHRTRKEDLIRVRSFLKPFNTSIHPLSAERPGKHLATYTAVLGFLEWSPYTGVEAAMSIHSPKTAPGQQSAALIWIAAPLEEKNAMQAGWTVAPSAFGDDRPRLFIFWQGKGNENGCFNLFCPGFIQYDSRYPIDQVLESSVYGGEQKEIELSIQRDLGSMDWWLMNERGSVKYGYWPRGLFPYFKRNENGGDQVGWGGVSLAEPNQPSPAMGSGHFPDDNFNNTAYFTRMRFYKNNWAQIPLKFTDVKQVEDTPMCFRLTKLLNYEKFGYGGPGGSCGV